MRVLQAPNKLTQDCNSSVGVVSFENGIATEFTELQGNHFVTKLGYKIVDVGEAAKVGAPGGNPKPETAEAAVKEAPAKTEEPFVGHVGNIKNLPGILVGAYSGEGKLIAYTASDEAGEFAIGGLPDEYELRFYGNDVSEEDFIIVGKTSDAAEGSSTGKPEEEKATGDTPKPGEAASNEGNDETVKLPVLTDKKAKIEKFCKKYGIPYVGTKAEMCEKIYADPRFVNAKK